MRQVKIFDCTGDGASDLEIDMNKWLKDHPDITIESVNMSARSPGDTSRHNRCFVLVLYSTPS